MKNVENVEKWRKFAAKYFIDFDLDETNLKLTWQQYVEAVGKSYRPNDTYVAQFSIFVISFRLILTVSLLVL